MKKYRYITILALMFQWSVSNAQKPSNIIIIIGDGMGVSHLSAPYYYGKSDPIFSKFKQIALVRTSSATHKVTDSAAGGTAMFGGRKTYNGAIGVGLDSIALPNLAEQFKKQGYETGLISSASITDATPAAFYAHQLHRTHHRAIATDLLKSQIDFFAGGGLQYFIDTSAIDKFEANNINVQLNKLKPFRNIDPEKRYGYLLGMDGLPPMLNGRKDFLSKASKLAIKHLSVKESGFILMVEGAQIDWAGHSNNGEYMITEMMDFEEAVSVAYNFAKQDKNTLVIVTADHETGGFTLGAKGENGYDADYSTIQPTFSTTNHSAAMVPLLAYGPGSENFYGIIQNTDIYFKVLDLIK